MDSERRASYIFLMFEKGTTHIVIGSLAVAVLLWFSVTMRGNFRTTLSVPLVVNEVPRGLALAAPLPAAVSVEVEGQGWQLLFLSLGRQVAYELSGKDLRSGVILTNRTLGESLKVPPGIRVLRASPDTLAVVLDRFISVRVPLRFMPSAFTFHEGYGLVQGVQLSPDSITLHGAERVLRRVASWPVETRAYTDLASPVTEDLAVVDSLPGVVHFKLDRVRLTIPVEEFADVNVGHVPIQLRNVPPGRQVLLATQTLTVAVRGGVRQLSQLAAQDLSVEIDYHDLLADTTGLAVPVVRVPTGMSILHIDPERIRYTVRE
jgi:hypothetical protein